MDAIRYFARLRRHLADCYLKIFNVLAPGRMGENLHVRGLCFFIALRLLLLIFVSKKKRLIVRYARLF